MDNGKKGLFGLVAVLALALIAALWFGFSDDSADIADQVPVESQTTTEPSETTPAFEDHEGHNHGAEPEPTVPENIQSAVPYVEEVYLAVVTYANDDRDEKLADVLESYDLVSMPKIHGQAVEPDNDIEVLSDPVVTETEEIAEGRWTMTVIAQVGVSNPDGSYLTGPQAVHLVVSEDYTAGDKFLSAEY